MTEKKKVPLTYNGVTVGEAEIEFDEKGANVKGHVFHPDVAKKILGPSLEAVSYGLDYGSLDFSSVIPNKEAPVKSPTKTKRTEPFIYSSTREGLERTMLNPIYVIQRCKDLLNEYEPSRERSLAATKLDEFEMWLDRCTVTQEAKDRDGSSQQ